MTAISVLLPFYNAEKYLGEAIESVLAQTHRDLELILIDDGSTDGGTAIAKGYAAKDPRIRFIQQANAGISETLNRGLKLARNEWVARMDADDVMMPNRLERQLDFISRQPDIAIASSFVYYINSRGRIIGQSKSEYSDPAAVAKAYANRQLIGFTHPAVIMRKSVIEAVGGYRDQFLAAEDTDLWNRVVETGALVVVQPEHLLKYRIHNESVSVAKAFFAAEQVAWLKACMRARRSGQAEPTKEQFLAKQAERSVFQKFNSIRKIYSKAQYKAAVAAWANREIIPALLRAFMSACLDPKFFFSKVAVRKLTSAASKDPI
jgi:glycosyltransferase involved in cell wall biosynthesis